MRHVVIVDRFLHRDMGIFLGCHHEGVPFCDSIGVMFAVPRHFDVPHLTRLQGGPRP